MNYASYTPRRNDWYGSIRFVFFLLSLLSLSLSLSRARSRSAQWNSAVRLYPFCRAINTASPPMLRSRGIMCIIVLYVCVCPRKKGSLDVLQWPPHEHVHPLTCVCSMFQIPSVRTCVSFFYLMILCHPPQTALPDDTKIIV